METKNRGALQSFREETKFGLSIGKAVYLELPKIIYSYGRTDIQLKEEIIDVSMSHELAYLLGFVDHPTKGESLITIQNASKHAILFSHQRPHNGGIFYYFLYSNLIEYQSIRNQKAPLLKIMPAAKTAHHKSKRFSLNICIIIRSQRIPFLISYLKFDQSLVNKFNSSMQISCTCFILDQQE